MNTCFDKHGAVVYPDSFIRCTLNNIAEKVYEHDGELCIKGAELGDGKASYHSLLSFGHKETEAGIILEYFERL
jgi:hypothetical protein